MLNNMVAIGERIRQKRNELGKKQQSFAEEIKIDNSSLSRYENGTQTPSLETLVQIANGLNTSLDYLVFGNGEENVKNVVHTNSPQYNALYGICTSIEENILYFTSIVDEVGFQNDCLIAKESGYVFNKFVARFYNLMSLRDSMGESIYQKTKHNLIKDYAEQLKNK